MIELEKMEKNPNPTKDQHFMVDQDMLQLIYDTAQIEEWESIVEIGGGGGALTDYLVQGNNYVTVIEKDPYYANLLKKKYEGYSNVTVIEGDALTYDFSSCDRIVANLPYTITEPFLINLASSGALDYNPSNPKSSNLKNITLVLSQNSTRKMVAPVQITEGKSKHINQEFGMMGAICKAFCDVDIVTAIPSEAFFPEPAVTSFVVNLTPKKEKTTVDRIIREMLIDKKGTRPSIKRVYQLMLSQEKIYKISKKYKDNFFEDKIFLKRLRQLVILGLSEFKNNNISQFNENILINYKEYKRIELQILLDSKVPKGSWRAGYANTDKDICLFATIDKTHILQENLKYDNSLFADDIIQWISQPKTAHTSSVGKMFINHKKLGYNVHIFIRKFAFMDGNKTNPFIYLGKADYYKSSGDKPMRILWKLEKKIPQELIYELYNL